MRPRRPRRAQLRTRVLASVVSITLVALAAFDIAAVTALRGYLLGQADSQLQAVLSPIEGPRLPSLLRQVEGPPRAHLVGEYYIAFVPGRGRAVILEYAGFASWLRPDLIAHQAGIIRPGRPLQHTQTVTSVRGHAQLRLLAIRADRGTLVAGTNIGQVNKTVDRLELIVIAGSLAAGLLVGLGVAWIVRRGLRPIETMAIQADRITAGDLTDRVGPHDPATEVGRLGTALNGMLARIEASIEEREASQELTRRFFADASHELRNPLASLRANAELYQQGALADRQQVDEAMRRITHEAQRMSALTDDMLRLARLDQRPGQQHDQVDLTALARECAQRAQIADPQRTWHARIADGLVTTGDEELLRRAIDNILANVRAHTPPETAATISAAGHDSTVTVDVSDNGPGVPADQLPHIFDRFYRAGQQSHSPGPGQGAESGSGGGAGPGSGLGLAIVAAIASTHDGTAEAAPGDPHGLRITLTLPGSSQPGPGQPGSSPAAAMTPGNPL